MNIPKQGANPVTTNRANAQIHQHYQTTRTTSETERSIWHQSQTSVGIDTETHVANGHSSKLLCRIQSAFALNFALECWKKISTVATAKGPGFLTITQRTIGEHGRITAFAAVARCRDSVSSDALSGRAVKKSGNQWEQARFHASR
jgi:hypothetical protein